jgi:acid phosphatase (class A)
VDGARLDTAVKASFNRQRPLVADPSINFCWPEQRQSYERSSSYPSGHAAWGWIVALLLAEMVPERSEALLARGREFGESRTVCGAHYPSDVEAGRMVGAAFVARLHAEPEFTRDLGGARRELRAALGLSD